MLESPCQEGTRSKCWEVRAAALPSDQVFNRWTAVIHLPQINTADSAHTRLGEGLGTELGEEGHGYEAGRGRGRV